MPRDPGPTDPWGDFAHQTRIAIANLREKAWIDIDFEAFGCGSDDCDHDHDHDVRIYRGSDFLRMQCSGNPAGGGQNTVPPARWQELKELGWGIEDSRRFVIIWRVDFATSSELEDIRDFWPLSPRDLDDITETLVSTLRHVYQVGFPSNLMIRQKRLRGLSRLFGDL